MEELYPMSVMLHWGFAVLTLGFALVHLWVLFKSSTFTVLAKKIHAFIPMYYFFLVCLFFTGLIAFTATHFHLTHWVAIMILMWVAMLGGSMRAYGLFKKTKFKHSESAQETFVKFAKKKYGFDTIVLLFLLVVA
jgi:flagellar basal body-associated protein FliL